MYYEEGHVIEPFSQAALSEVARIDDFFGGRRIQMRNYALQRATLCFRRLRVGSSPAISRFFLNS